MVITFDSSNMAVNAYEMLKNQTHEEKKLLCNIFLPFFLILLILFIMLILMIMLMMQN